MVQPVTQPPALPDQNPFDDPSISQANDTAAWGNDNAAYDNAAYGDAYEVNTKPPPPPMKAVNTQDTPEYNEYGYGDDNTGFDNNSGYDNGYDNNTGNSAATNTDQNDAYGNSAFADDGAYGSDAIDVNQDNKDRFKNVEPLQIQDVPESDLAISCFGYSYGRIWGYGAFCGILLTLGGILDFLTAPSFLDLIVNVYLILIGLAIMMAELPEFFCNRKIKSGFFKWARFTRRTWGKALLFFFFAVLCCTDGGIKAGVGGLVMVICFFLWFVSIQTARLAKKLAADLTEKGEADLEMYLERVFKGIANPEGDSLTHESIFKLGKQAGLKLNGAELNMIFNYFDEDADGKVCVEEFKQGVPRLTSGTNFL